MGSLTLIFGPMFSGKTTRLVQELTRFVDVTTSTHSTRCALINHTFDDRNEKIGVSSHASSFKGISNLIEILRESHLEDINFEKYDVIGIDEGQFFTNIDPVLKWIDHGVVVIVSGLITDANMKPFGKIHTLIPFADNIYHCHAICSECIRKKGQIITPDALSGMKAPFTFRFVSSDSNDQIDVGAVDKYIPVCRYHYNILTGKEARVCLSS
jgi:thymidine kinase